MLRPSNHTDAACVAGPSKLKSAFERTCLGPSPPLQHRVCLARYARAARAGCVPRRHPRAFTTTDGGFVGAGSYFALQLQHATRYA